MKHYAIIVAGGKGSRMGSKLPKQFHNLNGIPLLMHTLRIFHLFDKNMQLILVLPSAHFNTWNQLCKDFSFDIEHKLAEGGPERFHSVKSGLKLVVHDDALVAVHDAVRPLVNKEVINSVYKDAAYYGNAVPVIRINASVREWNGPDNISVDRSNLYLVQTPQCFKASILKKAYLQSYREEFTDDASVVENDGQKIHLVNGNPENIKITTRSDLLFAEAVLNSPEK
jgi:2-C-methyl-D-erythritol 4-phosphate cytidylyltransferase